MKVTVTEVHCPVSLGLMKKLYQVDYNYNDGNSEEWYTFGIYGEKMVAEFVKHQILVRRIRPVKLNKPAEWSEEDDNFVNYKKGE